MSEFKAENVELSVKELTSISGGKTSCRDESHGTNWGQSDTEYWSYNDDGTIANSWVEYADGSVEPLM